jgi:hypothetical protein
MDHPVSAGHKYRDLILQVLGLAARMTTFPNPKKWKPDDLVPKSG